MTAYAEEDVVFNTTILNSNSNHIDISKFSKAGYIMPGKYVLMIMVNDQEESEETIDIVSHQDGSVSPCITPHIFNKLGLKKEIQKNISWNDDGSCILYHKDIEYFKYRIDLNTSKFHFIVPQLYLEYTSKQWQPTSSWDNGISGLIFDYNTNMQVRKSDNQGNNKDLYANGTLGGNINAWRIRADWQSQYTDQNNDKFQWNRIYAYRAIPKLKSKLVIGEDYLRSDIFDSFSYIGTSLSSEDKMLPPNLRGYAPEVIGVAKTNALVTIRKHGNVIYQTRVPEGPFKIQDLDESINGELDVEVEEDNGSKHSYKMDVASVPYLTRPGSLRYKTVIGKPTVENQKTVDPLFGFTELSYGINNGWSIYGGAIFSDQYNAIAVGLGKDLKRFGALSVDSTISYAEDTLLDRTESGSSHRVSYSKRFDSTNSQVTFAGYRFSERGYMSLNEFIDRNENLPDYKSSKDKVSLSFSQYMKSIGVNAYLNYSYNTFWDKESNTALNFSISKVADIGKLENVSISLNTYNYKSFNMNDHGFFASITLPLTGKATVSYNGSFNNASNENSVSYSKVIDDKKSYQLNAGSANNNIIAGGSFSYLSDYANTVSHFRYSESDYTSLGLSLNGGITITENGAALHRNNIPGNTRIMVDTTGIKDIPVKVNGSSVHSNHGGTTVLSSVNDYYQNRISIDLDNIPDTAEVEKTVNKITLTEGAIGFSQFDVVEGFKVLGVITLQDGTFPPFGATVKNVKNRNMGILTDDGLIYLTGIQKENSFDVYWDDKKQCSFSIPEITANQVSKKSLLCIP